jgi:hypothetical protein
LTQEEKIYNLNIELLFNGISTASFAIDKNNIINDFNYIN